MMYLIALLVICLVLTGIFVREYIDKVREERREDVYEQGWTNGYAVGRRSAPMTLDASQPLVVTKKAKKPVKKVAKKITTKGA